MKGCVIFGAGIYGKQAHEYLKDRYEIAAYINSFNHVRKFDGLASIVERYGKYFDFSRYQRIEARNHKCCFLLQGKRI